MSVDIEADRTGDVTFHGNTLNASSSFTDNAGSAVIRNNRGLVTENNGTATVANGSTSETVSHGLDETPDLQDISVTPTNDLGNASTFWISDVGASNFDINVDADPGADEATFAWKAAIE
ncbi:MAG: hypothetical protein ACODAE_07700, partial [Gemmatimonadota bacterium]